MSWKMSGWVKVLKTDANGKKLSPAEKCVLYTLADYYNEESACAYPSIERLADESQVSVRHAKRLLQSLALRGVLMIERRVNATNRYQFLTEEGCQDVTTMGDTHVTSRVTPRVTRGDTTIQKGVTPMSPKPKENRNRTVIEPVASERIYLKYPIRKGKRQAIAAINAALIRLQHGESGAKLRTAAEAEIYILQALVHFTREREREDPRFTKWPQGWFNDCSYLDARYHPAPERSPADIVREQLASKGCQ